MPTVSVILPIYNELPFLKNCIRSIIENTKTPITLILVNDGSSSDTTVYCRKLTTLDLPNITVKHIENRINSGFTNAINQGIKHQESNYYCLLNTDTVIGTSNWLEKIIAVGESDPKIGILGPVSNNACNQSVLPDKDLPPEFTPKTFGDLLESATCATQPFILINGFCYIVKDSLLKDVGEFNQDHYPHYGSEDDLSMRAHLKGWKAVCLESVFIWHKRSQSYKANKQRFKDASCQLFTVHYRKNNVKEIINKDCESLNALRSKIKLLIT